MTEASVDELKRLYNQGKSMKSIARELGISYTKVRNILLNAGVNIRKKRINEQEVVELAKQGHSARYISKMLKISESSALRILKKHNVGRKIKKLSDDDINKIKEMYLKGESIYRIAKTLGKSTNLVVYHLKRLGVYKRGYT
ncbi:CRISPR-associated protein [Sulfolobus acidocaldarius SUSAZ]|nr:CRISPR-associated protein [Sulfolobus acidocaldarius SUSAZ]